MKKVFQKLKRSNFILHLLMILMVFGVATLGLNMSESYAQNSILGGTSNNLLVQGGAILANQSVPIGLTVLSGNVGIGTASPTYKLDVIGGIRSSAQSRFGANVGIYGGELFVEGDITTYGTLHTTGNLNAPLNTWGACVEVTTTSSCTNTWALSCPNGRFMTKVTNNGGSNTCVRTISCCHL